MKPRNSYFHYVTMNKLVFFSPGENSSSNPGKLLGGLSEVLSPVAGSVKMHSYHDHQPLCAGLPHSTQPHILNEQMLID